MKIAIIIITILMLTMPTMNTFADISNVELDIIRKPWTDNFAVGNNVFGLKVWSFCLEGDKYIVIENRMSSAMTTTRVGWHSTCPKPKRKK